MATEIGVSHNLIHKFIEGATPFERSLDRIEAWVDRAAAAVSIDAEDTAATTPAPNYEGLGIELPGYERLLERPRQMFDGFMVEMIARGLSREDLEELGRGLLAPIAGLNTLHKGRELSDARTEEDQVMILEGLIPRLRKIVRGGGI